MQGADRLNRIFINALIIIVSSLLLNTVGISFRVFISNKIGTEGMGLFQLIFSVYMMAILFVVTGINVAVTRLVAEEGGRSSYLAARAVIIKAFSLSFLFSTPAFLFLFYGAEQIGTAWLGDPRTILPLKLLAAGLPFAGISACVKGYFYAVGRLIRPTGSQALELAIQIAITIGILDYFMSGGPEYACAAVALGVTISEIAACMYNLTLYRFDPSRTENRLTHGTRRPGSVRKLLQISLPISASSLIRTGLKAMENIMIPIGFERYGYAKKIALQEYGKIHGMVIPVLMFPSTVILAFSALLIPEMSEANALNQKKRIEYSVVRSLQLTSFMSILIAGFFFFYSQKLGSAIYNSDDCGVLMKALAPLIPLIYLDIVSDELLKGLNQQMNVLRYNITDAAIKIVMIAYAVPGHGLSGLIFVLYVSGFINCAFNIRRLLIITGVRLKAWEWLLKPLLSAAVSGLAATLLTDLAAPDYFNDTAYIVVGAIIICLIYFTFLVMIGCLTKDDLKWLRSVFHHEKTGQNPGA